MKVVAIYSALATELCQISRPVKLYSSSQQMLGYFKRLPDSAEHTNAEHANGCAVLPFLEDHFDESARYVVNDSLAEYLAPLKDINETTLLSDEVGTTLGYFEPSIRYGTMVDGKPTVPYSDEEIKKLRTPAAHAALRKNFTGNSFQRRASMTFRVFWFPQADEELQQLLADPSGGAVISAAIERIDRSLAKYPTGFGESRGEDTYIAFERPLGVLYEVDRDGYTVVVVAVWRIDRK